LKAWDYTQVLSKIQKIILPKQIYPGSPDAYVEKLPFSELGTFVKQLLRENGKI
jgi:hypothetical protein